MDFPTKKYKTIMADTMTPEEKLSAITSLVESPEFTYANNAYDEYSRAALANGWVASSTRGALLGVGEIEKETEERKRVIINGD